MSLDDIAKSLESELAQKMSGSGMMFRLFSRVKSVASLRHKIEVKDKKYLEGKARVQDMLGLRIVLYFPDDVEAMSVFLGSGDVVRRSVDERDLSTFCPQRLNLTKNIPERYVADFRGSLPPGLAQYVDDTYEVQVRTVFSEGWHEVEHDFRYKCKGDWEGYESYSRTLNGMIATLETVEWGMKSIFHEMAYRNYLDGNYRAMLRNKLRIRFADAGYSPRVGEYLEHHREVAKQLLTTDRVVLVLSLLCREEPMPLTYDNVVFLINKIDIHDDGLLELERMEKG